MNRNPIFLLLIPIILFSFPACKKARTSLSRDSTDQALIQTSKAYFESNVQWLTPNANNYRACQKKSPSWNRAKVLKLSSSNVVFVPVTYRNSLFITSSGSPNIVYSLNSLTFLVISLDSQSQFHANAITFIPDSSSGNSNQSGFVLNEDWQGNSLSNPFHLGSQPKLGNNSPLADDSKQVEALQNIQVCNEIDGYNYSPDDPSAGYSWSENSCTTYEFQSAASGGPFGPGDIAAILAGRTIPLTVVLSAPKTPIANITDYFKCFTPGDAGHNFSVTLGVEQPVQGTRQPWTFTSGGVSGSSQAGNPINVGHSFLIFSEGYGGQPSTQRSVGFYPQGLVTPFATSAQGVLGDDEYTDYNICLTVAVSSSQFYAMLQYVSQGNNSGYMYDINSNNCTTFALDALDAGGISIPSTIGFWVGNGQGLDPGDLGEDIRSMQLPSNMSRNTVSNSHPNIGTCN
jgi:hypothetical protein